MTSKINQFSLFENYIIHLCEHKKKFQAIFVRVGQQEKIKEKKKKSIILRVLFRAAHKYFFSSYLSVSGEMERK